jgi:hypothetical protein
MSYRAIALRNLPRFAAEERIAAPVAIQVVIAVVTVQHVIIAVAVHRIVAVIPLNCIKAGASS